MGPFEKVRLSKAAFAFARTSAPFFPSTLATPKPQKLSVWKVSKRVAVYWLFTAAVSPTPIA